MSSQLNYLIDEIEGALAIYYSGRTGGQYRKTAFILCDDYTELLSKLFLLEDDSNWTDKKSKNGFKNFHEVLQDVKLIFNDKQSDDLDELMKLHEAIRDRRKRRNDFFHSTHLLDLNVNHRGCVDALCDLIRYGGLLMGDEWNRTIRSRLRMDTFCTLLKIEQGSFDDATLWPRVDEILKNWPRRDNNKKTISRKGTQYAQHPEDMHLRMCVDWGGRDLAEKLKSLLPDSE